MAVLANDPFSYSDGNLFDNAAWSRHTALESAHSTGHMLVLDGAVYQNYSSTNLYGVYQDATPSSGDYEVEEVYNLKSTSSISIAGTVVRLSGSSVDCFRYRWSSGGNFVLSSVVNNASSTVASGDAVSLSGVSVLRMKVRVEGTSIICSYKLDENAWVEDINTTSSAHNRTGVFGITSQTSVTSTTGAHLTEWTVRDLGGEVLATYFWHAPDTNAIYCSAKISAAATDIKFAASAAGDFTDAVRSSVVTSDASGWAKAAITGLSAATGYTLRIEDDANAQVGTLTGAARTLKTGAASFTFIASSCAQTGSNHANFDTIRAHDPDFFLHMGDLHYENINVNDVATFRAAYESVLAAARQHQLYREKGIVYIWDDHDFGPNNSHAGSTSKPAAWESFRRYAPHTPLATGDAPSTAAAIYRSFVHGRMRFIVTDCRSERSNPSDTDNSSKVVLSATQLAWFKDECLAAKAAGQAICWVNTLPWLGVVGVHSNDDGWPFYSTQRTEISNWLQENDINRRMFMVNGDMHACSINYGGDSNYATTPTENGPVVLHSAPLDQTMTSIKGGPYDELYPPSITNSFENLFGVHTVTDSDGEIEVTYEARDSGDVVRLDYSFTLVAVAPPVITAPAADGAEIEGDYVVQWQEGA